MSFTFDMPMDRFAKGKKDIDMLVEKLTNDITDERTLHLVLFAAAAFPMVRQTLIELLYGEPRRPS